MSVNTAHTNNGVLIHSGEVILLFSENATIEFAGQNNSIFKGAKQGHIFLTTHRMIFVAKNIQDDIKSFSFPFICLDGVQVDQPLLSGNYVRGKVLAQPNGNFAGQLSFKLWFKSGGALEFGQALLRAISMARSNFASSLGPPPYLSSSEEPVQAQPSSYTPEPNSYDWLPNFTFRYRPYQSRVFTQNISPPYPGITSNPQPDRATSGLPPPPPQVGFSPPLNPRYPFARGHPQQVPILGAYPPITTCGTPYSSCTPRPTTCGSPPYPPSSWNLQQPQIVYSPAPYANPMPTVSYAQGGIQQPPYPPQNIATGSSASQIQPNVPTAPSEDQSTIDEPPPSYGSLFPKEKKKTS